MPLKKRISTPFFSFNINNRLELLLKNYISLKKGQEITGGLIGDIKGGKKNNIIFDIKEFLPFPNLAEDTKNFVIPPKFWFDILDEWRLFYYRKLKFLGFLHTHPESSSKLSRQDKKFGESLKEKYGSVIFIIIGKNKYLRCYLFSDLDVQMITGRLDYYKLVKIP